MESAKSFFTAVVIALAAFATPASALDGCKVLLCLAGPWQSIRACTSELESLFRSLRNGDPFPSCSLASGGVYTPGMRGFGSAGTASAGNIWLGQWMPEPDPECPSQFVTAFDFIGAPRYGCQYAGVIGVHVGGQPWSRTYWNLDGASFTELSGSARSLGSLQKLREGGDLQFQLTPQPEGGAAAPAAQPSSSGNPEAAK